jgi:FG-GAP-like repeat/FG-GAP repeat
VFNGQTGEQMAGFLAYEWYFRGGVYVAAGDVNGDGRDEIILGAGAGGGPRVKVIDLATTQVLADFWGIADENFRGGARPAAGDINGDGRADLVVSAGETGGPRVAVYDGRSVGSLRQPARLAPDFYAFESILTNGAYVAVGDVDGDGRADLIAGSGEGGGPRVVVYDGAALTAGRVVQVASFMAGDANGQSGVRVAAADVDGDGLADILTGPGPNSDGTVRAFAGRSALRSASPTILKQYRSADWVAGGAFVG